MIAMSPVSDVAIVGMGAVFPGAGDAPTFWRNIRAGVDAITEVPPARWDPEVYYRPGESGEDRFYCRRGGFVDELADFDPAPYGIMPASVPGTEPDQLLVLRAAAEAIADCGTLPDRDRIGVIIGRGGYLTPGVARLEQRVHTAHQLAAVLHDLVPGLGAERVDAVRAAFTERLGRDEAGASIGLVPNFAASRVANRFDLRGPAYTVDAACASSLVAVDHAVRELASGRCDAVLAGGVHTCHHPTLWSVFTQLRALSPGEQIRPFDARADGTLLSEGTGAVLLKRLADALDAGDRVYAVIRGVGVASDGRATSLMNPLADGQELAMRRAWAAAALDPLAPDALGLLEAHGTATPTGDQVELTTLARVFGPPTGEPIGLGTVKSMIGHAMPAAGIAGLIKAAFAVHDGLLPPTLNVEQPHPALGQTRFEPITRARPWPDGAPRRAAVNAFGFGGINAHVILEATGATTRAWAVSAPAPRRPAGQGTSPAGRMPAEGTLRLAADSAGQMSAWLAATDAELLARMDGEPGTGPCRLAVVAPDARRLALARKIVERGTPWRGRSDIWFTPSPLLSGPEQVAFLFPGFEPEFAPRVEDVARFCGLPAPRLRHGGTFLAANTPGGTGSDPRDGVVEQALDVIAVSRLFVRALRELGITPGVLAGHSLGEWTAMIVAGIYPEIDAFMASMRPGMVEVPDVVYAALGTSAQRVSELLGGPGDVVISHDNCPCQSVVCGPSGQVAAVMEQARAAGILAQPLPFRTGFHTPMYAPYTEAARETLSRLEVGPPGTPVWSATSLAPFPSDPGQVRDLVLRHLVEPVRFRQLTELLHDSGVRAFVQLGPGSLTGFTADTLRDRDHLTVATAVPQRDGLGQLRRAAAALWADGLSPRFGRLDQASTASASPAASAPRGRTADRPAPLNAKGNTNGHRVRLRLGDPLVRLPELAATITAAPGPGLPPITAPPAIGLPTGTPVAAEFQALMAETAATAATVAQTLARPGPATPQPVVTPPHVATPVHPAATGPAAPREQAAGPGPAATDEIITTQEFSLRNLPDLGDHCIFPQAEGWPDDSDRFPVVPMTTLLEVMADAALELDPGRTVVGFEHVAAMRWLTVAPATTARVHASRDGADRITVRIEGYARGCVLLGDRWPEPPPPSPRSLPGERPAPVTAGELYTDRWMFHGPRFAGVADIGSISGGGITGTLLSLPARGALLDSAGQLIGHWMQVSHTVNQTVLPTGIRAVRLYGPQPPAGRRLGCTGWIREVTSTEMRADAELLGPDGRVWCRMEEWTTRRFATDDVTWRVKFHPERATLSQPHQGGWAVLWERWPDGASRELMMRSYLNAGEREHYERLDPRRQRQWLLRCLAVKDVVRHWLWDRGAGEIYPAEMTVSDPDGEPRVRGPFRAPRVSLAYCPPHGAVRACVVAIARDEGDEAAEFTISTDDEGTLLVTQPGRAPWPIDAMGGPAVQLDAAAPAPARTVKGSV
jgi:acyl transferase domain-containing protein